jgi:hypothetical protein
MVSEDEAAVKRDRDMAYLLSLDDDRTLAAIASDAALARQLEDEGFECPMCLEDWSIQNVVELGQCGHRQCRACVRRLINAELELNHWPIVCSLCKIGGDGDATGAKAYGGKSKVSLLVLLRMQ